jgi:flagellar motor switch protein FliM
VQDLAVEMDAALTHISLPLERILRLQPGEVLVLPMANLDQIQLVGVNGLRAAGAKLGQNRGLRALRLTDAALASPQSPKEENPQDERPTLAITPQIAQSEPVIGFDMASAADDATAQTPDFGADFPAFAAAL